MTGGWRWLGAWTLVGALSVAGCGGAGDETREPPRASDDGAGPGAPDAGAGVPDAGVPDAGGATPDGGGSGGEEGGTPDAGADAGTGGTPDAGAPDAGPVTVDLPTVEGWTFYGPQHGGPRTPYGVSADQGGNIWVAGGEEGLFLLRPGASRFQRFTMADGLRPYGLMRDGQGGPPPGERFLKVLSVAGGPAGTVFVGYEGKPPAPGMPTCEDEWDQAENEGREPDASVYKSGDADKVTLQADGTLRVVHYDIHTGPTRVPNELRGREKLCHVYRIVYDPSTRPASVWFGANHGFAWGDASFDGRVPSDCFDPRDWRTPGFWWDRVCAGLFEHVHPAINGAGGQLLTSDYRGVAPLGNGDVWFGGAIRSALFRYGTLGYWDAQEEVEGNHQPWSRVDVWPPPSGPEPADPTKAERLDDAVTAMAAVGDTVWVGSFGRLNPGDGSRGLGLAQLDASGQRLRTLSSELADGKGFVWSVARDTADDSVWAGMAWGGGLSRVRDGRVVQHFNLPVLGPTLGALRISDIQMAGRGSSRRVLVAFRDPNADASGMTPERRLPGAIGVYGGR